MKRASFAITVASALLGMVAVHSAGLAAQEPVRLGSRFIPHLAAAGGFDLRNGVTSSPAMYFGTASLQWSTSAPGLGLRLDGVWAVRGQRILLYADGCGPACAGDRNYWSKLSARGAFLGATYDLVREGAFRPYLLGGAGAVQTLDRSITRLAEPRAIDARSCTLRGALTYCSRRPISGAAQVGLGAVYSWRWISVLAEARFFAVDYRTTRGLNGAFPLSLGLRF